MTGEETAILDQLVGEYLDAKAAAERWADIARQAEGRILQELDAGQRHELLPGVGIRVQAPANTFNADKAREILTAEQYASICEPKPSAALAKKMLPGALADLCKTPGTKPSVRIL